MKMYDCPKFESCNALVCPLFRPVYEQSHERDTAVCYYLREYQKAGSEAAFRGSGLGELYELMAQASHDAFFNPDTDIYLVKSLRKAATTSSVMVKGQNHIKRLRNGEFKKDADQDAKV